MLNMIAFSGIALSITGFMAGGLLGGLTGLVASLGIGSGVGIAVGDKKANLDKNKVAQRIQRMGGVIVAVSCSWAVVRGGWHWGWLWVTAAYVASMLVVLAIGALAMRSEGFRREEHASQ